MNVYDFDGTIFRGDCSIQFYLFCLRHRPSIIFCFPKQCIGMLSYLIGHCTKKEWKECFFSFLDKIDDIDILIEKFWKCSERRIASWYLDQKESTDLVISASPEFIIAPICEKLGIGKPIASRVEKKTGKFISENCYGMEKVKRFRKEYPNIEVENFYTDSKSDLPMMQLARNSYMVKSGNIYLMK